MLFKPLSFTTDFICAFTSDRIFNVHKTFPRTFQAKRVCIYLCETIDKVYRNGCILHPLNTEIIVMLKITRAIISKQRLNGFGLHLGIDILKSILKMCRNTIKSLTIQTALLVHLLVKRAISCLCDTAIETITRRCLTLIFISLILQGLIISLHSLLLYSSVVEVDATCLY